MRKERENLRKNFKMLEKKQETTNKGITLIALVVTIVVLLILASVSITVVFGDNGILQLAKEAGEKTNEAVQKDLQGIQNLEDTIGDIINNGWSINKVTAVTSADGKMVPVPKGFVGSGATGENKVSEGFVIYEGTEPVTDKNVSQAREERNQFVWVPVDGKSLKYEQDKTSWSDKTSVYTQYKDWWDEEKIDERKTSVEKYGGFYVGRYEAGVEESNTYTNEIKYAEKENEATRNISTGTPVTKKGRQAWNYVSQTNAKILSENMYKTSASVTSRLMDSYAWDTICKWFENDKINVKDSTSWGNYKNASYNIKGLYAIHTWNNGWTLAEKYSMATDVKGTNIPEQKDTIRYEVATGATVVDYEGKEIDRNKAKNIYDFAGNMWEWTTEIGNHSTEEPQPTSETKPTETETQTHTGTHAVIRGGGFGGEGGVNPASSRHGDNKVTHCNADLSFHPVLYIKLN